VPDPSYVVTGGAGGIGRAVVDALAREGHVVVIDMVDELDGANDRVRLATGDAGDPEVAAAWRWRSWAVMSP
jgi:NAD(P)-dependent dehydrogenase (short-subunit alcohol dehydrogenase family)